MLYHDVGISSGLNVTTCCLSLFLVVMAFLSPVRFSTFVYVSILKVQRTYLYFIAQKCT
jgi:hypothetical protein